MSPTSWDEVGRRFTELGHTVQRGWSETRDEARSAESSAADEVRSAMEGVRTSLDELSDAITRTVHDDRVHDAARSAAGGLVEALGASLDELADKLDPKDPDEPGR